MKIVTEYVGFVSAFCKCSPRKSPNMALKHAPFRPTSYGCDNIFQVTSCANPHHGLVLEGRLLSIRSRTEISRITITHNPHHHRRPSSQTIIVDQHHFRLHHCPISLQYRAQIDQPGFHSVPFQSWRRGQDACCCRSPPPSHDQGHPQVLQVKSSHKT